MSVIPANPGWWLIIYESQVGEGGQGEVWVLAAYPVAAWWADKEDKKGVEIRPIVNEGVLQPFDSLGVNDNPDVRVIHQDQWPPVVAVARNRLTSSPLPPPPEGGGGT